jgi:hypothetical protein
MAIIPLILRTFMGLSPGSRMNPGRGHGAEKSELTPAGSLYKRFSGGRGEEDSTPHISFLLGRVYQRGALYFQGLPSALCEALRLARDAQAQLPPAGISPDAGVAATPLCCSAD